LKEIWATDSKLKHRSELDKRLIGMLHSKPTTLCLTKLMKYIKNIKPILCQIRQSTK